MENAHKQHRSRMKQRFLDHTLADFQPHEVVELLLYYSIPRSDTNPLAHRLIDKFGSVGEVLSASREELLAVEGMGESSATFFALLSDVFRLCRMESAKPGEDAGSFQKVSSYARALFSGVQTERLYLLCLDSRSRIRRELLLCEGGITEIQLSPRAVVDAVLRSNAASVIFLHNHPGGSEAPSQADREFTLAMQSALSIIDVTVSDHIIVGAEGVFSFALGGIVPAAKPQNPMPGETR